MLESLGDRWNLNTLIITAVPAPETANNPTARTAWDQWKRERVMEATGEIALVGAAAAGCGVCAEDCGWMPDDDFCPSAMLDQYSH